MSIKPASVLVLIILLLGCQGGEVETVIEPTVTPIPAPESLVVTEIVAPQVSDEQLVAAVKAGDTAEVERLLEAGADPNAVDNRGYASLALAAMYGKLGIARLLLDAGADVDGTIIDPDNGEQLSALHQAAMLQHNDVAELLIAHGADVNWLWDDEKEGWGTPLHIAALKNNVEMVSRLLDNGADPNLRSKFSSGTTPLHWALREGNVECAQALLDNGAEVDLATDWGVTPLMQTINHQGSSGNLAAGVALLLEAGADPDLQNKIGETALHYAARERKAEAVSLLIEHGADIDIENMDGLTPLDVAASSEIKEMLQKAGAGE